MYNSKILKITKPTQGYWNIKIDNPPINLFDPEMVSELEELIVELESDKDVRVVVFESQNPDYFVAHLDVARAAEFDVTPKESGLSAWPDVAARLEKAPFVTIGKLRGRARGVGSEFLLALDMRFASREKAILNQIEIGAGLMPGGGGLERLPLLIGRSRALEAIIGSEDFDAETAERYGWVNRAIADSELDEFVDNLARRIAAFDRQAISVAKSIVNKYGGIPQKEDVASTQVKFFEMLEWPQAQARMQKLVQKGFGQNSELELNMGKYLGPQD